MMTVTNCIPRVQHQSELAGTVSKEGDRRKERTDKKNCIWGEKDCGLLRDFWGSYKEHFIRI